MLSYLEVVKKLVDTEIYNRGVRLYLEGKVLGHKELILDYWRSYEVQGRADIYTVDLPLLHLALSQGKYEQADRALKEVVRSDSPYFLEFGVCQHVVAVCAALDQEFKIKPRDKKSPKISSDEVWNRILEAESGKKEREWIAALEVALYSGFREQSRHFRQLKEMLVEVVENQKAGFPVGLEKIFSGLVGDYLLEKNLLKLFVHPYFLSKGGLVWWRLIEPFLGRMDRDNQVKAIQELWKNRLAGNTEDFDPPLTTYFQELDSNLKEEVLQALELEFSAEPKNWIGFALVSKNAAWLEKNLDKLDGHFLVLIAKEYPDRRETLEQKLGQQTRVWSDFLQPGEYDELLDLLKQWKQELGSSDYLEETIKYIKQNHPRKTKLINGIDSLS